MHVLSRKRLMEAAQEHSDLAGPLDVWHRIAKKAKWTNLAEVRNTWAFAASVERYTVFNIKGNDYRLIAEINYHTRQVYVRHVLTHAEYDRGRWKK